MITPFKLTEQHITLLRNMHVTWHHCETGAPQIDPKRPYGNSYVPGDIHKILTGEDTDLTEDQEENYLNLHRETEEALRVFLANAKISKDYWTEEWEADVVNESDDYLIYEWFDLQDLQVYYSILDAKTRELFNKITPRIKTLDQAKEIVRNLRKYRNPIFHSVEC